MTFADFQNRARLYVIGALYPDEMVEFRTAERQFGSRAEQFIGECQALHEAFALSLRPASSRERLNRRVMAMAKQSANG